MKTSIIPKSVAKVKLRYHEGYKDNLKLEAERLARMQAVSFGRRPLPKVSQWVSGTPRMDVHLCKVPNIDNLVHVSRSFN